MVFADVLGTYGDADFVLVRGLKNSGKTELALRRAASWVERGIEAGDVLVVVATEAAVEEARRSLPAGVWVTTARDLELDVLARRSGACPRLLTNYEDDFVKEDLKTTGVDPRRLKGMLGFFRKSLTTLEADDPYFFWEQDEKNVFNLARTCMAGYGVVHPAALAGMCLRSLRDDAPAEPQQTGLHIVADDYQALNRASQLVLEALAPKAVWAFADELDQMEGCDPFPYPAGLSEFAERTGAVEVDLEAPDMSCAAGAAAVLATSGYLDALSLGVKDSRGEQRETDVYEVSAAPVALRGVDVLESASWRDEFPGLAERVGELLGSGSSPADVVVAAPNLTWVRSLSKAFAARGIPVRRMNTSQLAGGDFRDEQACGSARFMTLLALAANPRDGMAWRAWCGFGDSVARSNVFAELLTHDCAEEGRSCIEALECLVAAASEGSLGPAHAAVAEAYLAGGRHLDRLSGLKGRALISGIVQELGLKSLGEAVVEACLSAGEDADAAQMYASLYRRAMRRDFFGDEGGVRICTYEGLCGISAKHLFVAGCMNGWLPEHAFFDLSSASSKRRIMIDQESRRMMYSICGAASQTLTVSSFSDVDLEVSERLNLKGYRVFAGNDGRRHMSVRRSVVADYALVAWGVLPYDETDLRLQVNPY